jgi:hypothetical protein
MPLMLASRDIVLCMQVGMLVEQEKRSIVERPGQGPGAQFGHDRGLRWQRSECYNHSLRTIDIEARHLNGTAEPVTKQYFGQGMESRISCT